MIWILAALAAALVAALVAISATGVVRRARRNSLRGGGKAAPEAASDPGDGAWVSRITQTIPTVVRRLADLEGAKPESRGGLGLQGNLAQTPLHDLLQYLALGRKSGVLELASGRRTGRIVLTEGRIGRTSYRGKEGMEAAFLMLDLAEGDFEFYEQGAKPADMGQPMEVVDVIMLWMARKPKKQRTT